MNRWDTYVSRQGLKQLLKSKPFQFTLALFDKSSIDLCTTLLLCKVYQLCLEGLSAMPVIHTITEIRSAASPYTSVCAQSHKPSLCFFSLAVPALTLLAHTLPSQTFLFSTTASPPFYFLFLYLCCLFLLLSPPLSVCLPLFLSLPLSVVGSLPGTMHIPSWKI